MDPLEIHRQLVTKALELEVDFFPMRSVSKSASAVWRGTPSHLRAKCFYDMVGQGLWMEVVMHLAHIYCRHSCPSFQLA